MKKTLSLKNISNCQFNQFLPAGNQLGTVIGKEIEWFADDPENEIGTIAFNTSDRGWNYAILRRDWKGDFQVYDLKAKFQSFPEARADFLLAMRAAKLSERYFRFNDCRVRQVSPTLARNDVLA